MARSGTSALPMAKNKLARTALYLAGLVLFILTLCLLGDWNADWALRKAVEQADQSDPQWRLLDLEARRSTVPDEENAAIPLVAAAQLLPKNWPFWSGFYLPDTKFSEEAF